MSQTTRTAVRPQGDPAVEARPTAAPPVRDAFFDNAKYLAIVLVAVGHAWEPLRDDSRTVTALYTVVYAFHMPAFIVISGYFSRNFDGTPRRVRRLVTGIAVPYVLFETAYTFFTRWTDGVPDRPVSLLDPLYLTWFLASLFVWRLTTPLWRSLRRPLPVALVVAMLATMSPSIGEDLDLQRLLQFLPYFVLGLCLRPEHFQMVQRRRVRLLALPVFAGAFALAYFLVPRFTGAWLFHRASAVELGAPTWAGPLMTLALFGVSVLLTACFLAWVPGRTTWFTVLGAGTLSGYLLHGFVAQLANHLGWYHPGWMHGPAGAVVTTLVAASVVTVLCTPAVRRLVRFAVEPTMEWAFRRSAERPADQPGTRDRTPSLS
ncbi:MULTISPECIES: acyltransferase family protein [Streptomyces]|uniref:Acyltransferase family protein n=1 Tax=Streptomyces doudnae TaxID=3075536 RepID=A0ABD5F0A7_9ACTN|nr:MULTISPECIES: acyltransferase family protein [unclassified Streptomyces]MDT0439550.1 acyltransferase family protein [Streptomyces sp. DSM 41981]SCE46772.1 Fucose 4-O-acetylase [Streptomyces sp. SolWspMP-5a-2]